MAIRACCTSNLILSGVLLNSQSDLFRDEGLYPMESSARLDPHYPSVLMVYIGFNIYALLTKRQSMTNRIGFKPNCRILSAVIFVFVVACTPDEDLTGQHKRSVEEAEFQESMFEAYERRCDSDTKCLSDIAKLRECYLEKGVYDPVVDLTDQKAIVQLFETREQCQRDLGLYDRPRSSGVAGDAA